MARYKKIVDKDIRVPFIQSQRGLVIEEMGCGYTRADVVVITKREMRGYEIKSESDTLSRLEHQVGEYNKLYDKCVLVVHNSHYKHLAKTIEKYGITAQFKHWGVITCGIIQNPTTKGRRVMRFTVVKQPTTNPYISYKWLKDRLWKVEIVVDLWKAGWPKSVEKKSKTEMLKILTKDLTKKQIRDMVRGKLLVRNGYPDEPPKYSDFMKGLL